MRSKVDNNDAGESRFSITGVKKKLNSLASERRANLNFALNYLICSFYLSSCLRLRPLIV